MTIDTREILETENGPIDLTDLSNEEKLICAFLEFVDPNTYDGGWSCQCLIGQTAGALGETNYLNLVGHIARRYDISEEKIITIYHLAASDDCRYSLDNAMNMARRELGVTRF